MQGARGQASTAHQKAHSERIDLRGDKKPRDSGCAHGGAKDERHDGNAKERGFERSDGERANAVGSEGSANDGSRADECSKRIVRPSAGDGVKQIDGKGKGERCGGRPRCNEARCQGRSAAQREVGQRESVHFLSGGGGGVGSSGGPSGAGSCGPRGCLGSAGTFAAMSMVCMAGL